MFNIFKKTKEQKIDYEIQKMSHIFRTIFNTELETLMYFTGKQVNDLTIEEKTKLGFFQLGMTNAISTITPNPEAYEIFISTAPIVNFKSLFGENGMQYLEKNQDNPEMLNKVNLGGQLVHDIFNHGNSKPLLILEVIDYSGESL